MSFYEDKIFPLGLDLALAGLRDERIKLVSSAEGDVLEIGIGNGANLPFYSKRASKVYGIEPCAAMVDMAAQKLENLHAKSELALTPDHYDLRVGSGEELPYESNHFDSAVACLVFCTIPNAEKAAREMFRVLKPGGKVYFLEHVHALPGLKHRLQNWINPIWKPIACGCNLNRDTKKVFDEAGFQYQHIDELQHQARLFPLFSSIIKGVAYKP